MMRFTFLQLCAATVPVPIPQQETERNLSALSVELWTPWADQTKKITLQQGLAEDANMKQIAKELQCDPVSVTVVDHNYQLVELGLTGEFWASCVLKQNAPMAETFNQLVLTGLVLYHYAGTEYPPAWPDDTKLCTNGQMKYYQVPQWRNGHYSNESQNFVMQLAKRDKETWKVMFCLQPKNTLCNDKIEISSTSHYDEMHVTYYQKQAKRAKMTRTKTGLKYEEVSENGPKALTELSDAMKKIFRDFATNNLRFVAAQHIAYEDELVRPLLEKLRQPLTSR